MQLEYTFENALYYQEERTAVFIDGSNLYAILKQLEYTIDFKLLLGFLRENTNLRFCGYYSAIFADDAGKVAIQPLLDYLAYNNYNVRTKMAKQITLRDGTTKIKGNMDLEIALEAIQIAPTVDHIMLFTGDGDFVPLVHHLQANGKRVSVVASIKTPQHIVADDLRKAADHFVDIDTAKLKIGKLDQALSAQSTEGGEANALVDERA